jgi:hopanoid C-2 methylase
VAIGTAVGRTRKRRVLIVNCYFDDIREDIPRTRKIPMPMGPAYLAGAFDPRVCDVRVYDEFSSGALRDPKLLAWPEMVVLTGLTTSFDRMLHIAAYVRTLNERVPIVAGGPGIRSFPSHAQQFFDYCCLGDIEELRKVAREVFGSNAVAENMHPRFDLAYWIRNVGHVESSRHCNFHCSFCTLTAEGNGYQKYDLSYTRRQILDVGYKDFLLFIDNNFYGNDARFFRERLALLEEMHSEKRFGSWAALVTNDFFYDDANLEMAKKSGCVALFSGVESFDTAWLSSMNKRQNARLPQVEMISKCLRAGIIFLYGMLLDVTSRSVDDLDRELRYVLRTPEITLPSYLSLPIPYPGTPFFRECVDERRLLPNTRVRDLNSSVLCIKPMENMRRVLPFIARTQTLAGYRREVVSHTWKFYRKYRKTLTPGQIRLCMANSASLLAHEKFTSPGWIGRTPKRTYVSSSERLDRTYRPAFAVDPRYEHYFAPTMLTDPHGDITASLEDDVFATTPIKSRGETLVAIV